MGHRECAKKGWQALTDRWCSIVLFAPQPRESSCAVILGPLEEGISEFHDSFVAAAAVDGYDAVILWWQKRQRQTIISGT